MLNLTNFLIKEEIGFFKLSNTYHIFDPVTGVEVGVAKEDVPMLVKILRAFIGSRLFPTTVHVTDKLGTLIFTIKKTAMFLKGTVTIFDAKGNKLGSMVNKVFTIGGSFDVFNNYNEKIASLQGDWVGWNFRFISSEGKEIGVVSKQWAGFGKEIFTNADNYIISISDGQPGAAKTILLLAAALAVDIIYKEQSN